MPAFDSSHVRQALSRLRETRARILGADAHGFRLNPPLSESEVLTFEQSLAIMLPSDYRAFLTSVGNGGAGPFYGLFPLGTVDGCFDLRKWEENDGVVGLISQPFLLEREWNDLSTFPPQRLLDEDPKEYEKRIDAFDQFYWSCSRMNGAIPICHQGCGLRLWLIVRGAEAGYVWEDRRADQAGLKPVRGRDGKPLTFIAWYQQWLENCLENASEVRAAIEKL
jgi:hypothetical protein